MDAGQGHTQCTAQRARVENVKSRSFNARFGITNFYSRRASCASAAGGSKRLVWRSKGGQSCQTARQLRPVWTNVYGLTFCAQRAILVLLNAVMSQVPTGLGGGSRAFGPLRTAPSRSPVIRSGRTLAGWDSVHFGVCDGTYAAGRNSKNTQVE